MASPTSSPGTSPRGRTTAYSPLFVQRKPGKHELPALNIPSSSLTEGTDIPAPEESPVKQEAPSQQETVSTQYANGSGKHAGKHAGNGSSTPQTPLAMESPNPLRSHPTSIQNLSRQYQLDADADRPPTSGGMGPTTTTTVTANGPGASSHSSKRGADQSSATSSHQYQSSQYSQYQQPTLYHPQPPKRQTTSDSISPPSKRPLSVRKFLGLRALGNALTGRSSSEKERSKTPDPNNPGGHNGNGVYHQRNRSTDMLSLFSLSRRPESRQSNAVSGSSAQQPSLKKRRSSLMLLARRGSNFFGLTVDEDPEGEQQQQQEPERRAKEGGLAMEHPYRTQGPPGYSEASGNVRGSGSGEMESEVSMEETRPRTPPPSLPALGTLRGSRGLHNQQGGFMDGDEMFRDIQ